MLSIIATGEEGDWTRVFFKEQIPFFDVTSTEYWLVDKSLYKPKEEEKTGLTGDDETIKYISSEEDSTSTKNTMDEGEAKIRRFKSITISGNVAVENYNQLFSSFVMPLAQNKIEIEIRIKAKSTEAKPLTENSTEYKVAKESAKQLGLDLQE